MVLDTLVAAADLMEARERIRKKKKEGETISSVFEDAKALTAMYHFNEIGCKIGKSALEKKKQLADLQQKKKMEARTKEEDEYRERKRTYDDIVALNLDDEKLSGKQLSALLMFKKRKTDKGISHLNKAGHLKLWKEWKARWDEPPKFENSTSLPVNKPSLDSITASESSSPTPQEIDIDNTAAV